MEAFKVQLTKQAEKELEKLPQHIVLKLAAWIEDVGRKGISEVRKLPGYHDDTFKRTKKRSKIN